MQDKNLPCAKSEHMKLLFTGVIALFLIYTTSCNNQTTKEQTSDELISMESMIIGKWVLSDIVFLSPIADSSRAVMEKAKANVLASPVMFEYKADNSAIESFRGQPQAINWEIKDSLLIIKYTENQNFMLIKSIGVKKMNLIIGTQEDRSEYIFTKQ